MRLELNGKEIAEDLSEEVVKGYIAKFVDGEIDSFLILSKNNMNYIQVYKEESESFLLEYQSGSLKNHFKCANQNLSKNQISSAFVNFFLGGEHWQNDFTWKQDNMENFSEDDESGSVKIKLLHMAIFIVLVSFFLIFLIMKKSS